MAAVGGGTHLQVASDGAAACGNSGDVRTDAVPICSPPPSPRTHPVPQSTAHNGVFPSSPRTQAPPGTLEIVRTGRIESSAISATRERDLP